MKKLISKALLAVVFTVGLSSCVTKIVHKQPPEGYTIVTNGYEYAWQDRNRRSSSTFDSKQKALDYAWTFYETLKVLEAVEEWRPVELERR